MNETAESRVVATPARNKVELELKDAVPHPPQESQELKEVVEVRESQPITPTQHEATPSKHTDSWSQDRQPDGPSPLKVQVSPAAPQSPELPPPSPAKCVTPKSSATTAQQVEPPNEVASGGEEAEAEPAADLDLAAIPALGDPHAPKPKLGQHTLSKNAIRCRTNRIFKRKSDGSAKVSEEIFKEWHQGGEPRKTLEAIFMQVRYDVESCWHRSQKPID